eukprot:g8810.t1
MVVQINLEGRSLSLPKTVVKRGAVDWNSQAAVKGVLQILDGACQAKTVDEALAEVRGFTSLGHMIWAYAYLRMLHHKDPNLFYRTVMAEPSFLMPIVYTPTVGEACQKFGQLPLLPRGCYVSLADRGNLKADLYTVCAGFNPHKTMPVMIDAGCTDANGNAAKLTIRDHILYHGMKENRVKHTSKAGTEVNSAYYGEDSFIGDASLAVRSCFTEEVVQAMLSDCYKFSRGQAIFGSGTRFPPVEVQGRTRSPGQVNNFFIFPGMSFAAVCCEATKITDHLFMEAAQAVANSLDKVDIESDSVLPNTARIRDVGHNVATAVVLAAQKANLAQKPLGETWEEVAGELASLRWDPAGQSPIIQDDSAAPACAVPHPANIDRDRTEDALKHLESGWWRPPVEAFLDISDARRDSCSARLRIQASRVLIQAVKNGSYEAGIGVWGMVARQMALEATASLLDLFSGKTTETEEAVARLPRPLQLEVAKHFAKPSEQADHAEPVQQPEPKEFEATQEHAQYDFAEEPRTTGAEEGRSLRRHEISETSEPKRQDPAADEPKEPRSSEVDEANERRHNLEADKPARSAAEATRHQHDAEPKMNAQNQDRASEHKDLKDRAHEHFNMANDTAHAHAADEQISQHPDTSALPKAVEEHCMAAVAILSHITRCLPDILLRATEGLLERLLDPVADVRAAAQS